MTFIQFLDKHADGLFWLAVFVLLALPSIISAMFRKEL